MDSGKQLPQTKNSNRTFVSNAAAYVHLTPETKLRLSLPGLYMCLQQFIVLSSSSRTFVANQILQMQERKKNTHTEYMVFVC